MALTLAEYPDAIAQAEIAVLEAQGAVLTLAQAVEERRAQFAAIVAGDGTLKNEAQRKAALAELQGSDPELVALGKDHARATESLALARIEVDRLKRLYEVTLKLQ